MRHALLTAGILWAHVLLMPPKSSYAEFPPKHGKFVVYVERVKDGDTIKFYHLVPEYRGRLFGCNAPEKDTDAGKAAQSALAAMLPPGLHEVELLGPEKFGGVLFRARTQDGDVATLMIGAGHAKPWDGKGPRP